MATTKAVIIWADGKTNRLDLPREDAVDVLHNIIGGYFDIVRHDEFVAYVDDEGLFNNSPLNVIGSILMGRYLCGNMVLVGALNEEGVCDGENYDLPEIAYRLLGSIIHASEMHEYNPELA